MLWSGSDDGLLHVSRDDGKTWAKVTPPDLPEWSMINSLEAHPTQKGGLYVAATRYKLDDNRPYLYKTTDYGKTWTKIVTGIKEDHFTRVVRADPKWPGLLCAGTEAGVYVSFDDGVNWKPFQLDLPIVPVTDLAIKNDDLYRRDARPVVLGARRPHAAASGEARGRDPAAAPVPATPDLPTRRRRWWRRRGQRAVAGRRPEPAVRVP